MPSWSFVGSPSSCITGDECSGGGVGDRFLGGSPRALVESFLFSPMAIYISTLRKKDSTAVRYQCLASKVTVIVLRRSGSGVESLE